MSSDSRPRGRVDLDRAAERDDGEGDVDLAVQVVAVALELRVLGDVDDDVEVAGGAAGKAGLALAVQPQPLARRDAGGDLHGELALAARRVPAPRHAVHGLLITRPVPRHMPQVRATVKNPCW